MSLDMRRNALLILVVGLLIAADAKENDAGKNEVKKLEGTYVMVSGEAKGEKLPEKTIKNAKLTIEGNKHIAHVGEDTIIGTHKLDPTKKPKEIDAMDTEGPFKGTTTLGIYKVEKGEFTTKSSTGELLHVWKKKQRE